MQRIQFSFFILKIGYTEYVSIVFYTVFVSLSSFKNQNYARTLFFHIHCNANERQQIFLYKHGTWQKENREKKEIHQ